MALNPSKTYDGGSACETNCIHCGSVETGYRTPTNGETSAGMGQINHSEAGPNLKTNAHPKIPTDIPNKKRIIRNGMTIMP